MVVLGSTGSIGCLALEIARQFGKPIEAMSAGKNITLFNEQILAYRPKFVAIANECDIPRLESQGAEIFVGDKGICAMLERTQSQLVINAIVGFAGLLPSLHIQKLGKTLALANKESLVSGGWLLDTKAIIPIDSEHFGLWYLRNDRSIKRLVITASGGAFRDTPLESIYAQTKKTALQHPNWQMGQKITIDSASMANKLFEILEAFWLFGCKSIEAFIERSSSIHALIEFLDGSTTAHFALPDMRLPIAYAINPCQAAHTQILESIDLSKLAALQFAPIDSKRYPLYVLKERLLENPKLGVIVNASNEAAIDHFLADRICFGEIANMVFEALTVFEKKLGALADYEAIVSLDAEVRKYCCKLL